MPTKPKTKFVIDRKRWYRGKGGAYSRLLRHDGAMCCLGQVARQCGLRAKDIRNECSPGDVDTGGILPAWLFNGSSDSEDCKYAMSLNDAEAYSDKHREKWLKRLFKKHGAQLTFIN